MKSTKKTIDRSPAVAGQFYPADPDMLQKDLANLFAAAMPKQCNHVRAIISPHAGYVFSGKTAASVFNQIDPDITYKRIFLIASSHHAYFESASVYCDGNYIMPYGKEIVDTTFGNLLVERFPGVFTANRDPHMEEHSLEVQLPFLHHVLKTRYRIIPIIIGTSDPTVCKRIASILKPYLNPNNLFVISSDFSHFPEYNDAKRVDAITKEAILANDPEILLMTLAQNARKNIPHLATSLCGWTSVLTLLYMTTHNDTLEFQAIDYSNSGDARYFGEKDRVVGYWGIAISEKIIQTNEFRLAESDKEILLNIARKTIEVHCHQDQKANLDAQDFSDTLKMKCGAFVTLRKKGNLRGCIGRLTGDLPLFRIIQEMAISAASHDYRFMPVEAKELQDINIEISVLSPLNKIDDIKEIELGKHGIYIEKGHLSGVFLPQVATETGWSKEEFLGHCACDKAGIGWDGWKTANIYTFTATVFGEKE